MSRRIPRNVLLLGLLSLFNDVTADVITPLLPAYLATMGLGASFLGVMEGLASSISNMTMLFSGWYADRRGKGKALTIGGYALCTFARLFYALPLPEVTLSVRILDRFGKGIRTAPRDQLLTESMEKSRWGEAFGIQRMMDHTGSLIGPLAATAILAAFSIKLPTLFLVASIPAILSVLIIPRFIKTVPAQAPPSSSGLSWKRLPRAMKIYVALMFLSALTTPSELFLIMKMKDLGLAPYQMPMAWFAMTISTLVATYVGGRLSDAWSRRRTIALGWILFSVIYAGFAFNGSLPIAWGLIAAYGFHTGLIEPAERAYPATVATSEVRATTLGWYYFAYGMGLLPASLLFGLIWDHVNSRFAFLLNAGLTVVTTMLLTLLPSDRPRPKPSPDGVPDPDGNPGPS
ncbi:MAG TPA: MFS transporter [bacterium]|nr:MFS transporter [bacterium]